GAERAALSHGGREFIKGNVALGNGGGGAPIAVVSPFWGRVGGRGGGGRRRGRGGGVRGTRRRSLVSRRLLLNHSGSRRLLGSLLTHNLQISSQESVRGLL